MGWYHTMIGDGGIVASMSLDLHKWLASPVRRRGVHLVAFLLRSCAVGVQHEVNPSLAHLTLVGRGTCDSVLSTESPGLAP